MYTHPEYQAIILFYKGFINGRRIAIIRALLQKAYTPLELCALLYISAPAMSRHLAVLQRAGIIYGVRKGNAVYFFVRKPEMIRKVLEFRF